MTEEVVEFAEDEQGPKKVAKKKRKKKGSRSRAKKKQPSARGRGPRGGASDYPRHAVRKALRIPQAILDQNAGRACTDRDAARFSGVGFHGPFRVEVSSSIKFGFLRRPEAGSIEPTDLAKQVLRPQNEGDQLSGLRQAVLTAPKIGDVYRHYRGENIPDEPFFTNALTDTFGIPSDKLEEFREFFLESLHDAQLTDAHGEKLRVLDVLQGAGVEAASAETLKRLGKGVKIEEGDTCFVVMPFQDPVGAYYKTVYEPAIKKAGLRPVRADDDMFATGKIIDQIWSGIHAAKLLVAELTGRNANVFYELGLAHALQKPVVLVSSNEQDVPFDVHHIRVIYYDVYDPFWGEKLLLKIAENILSAIQNPGEAVLKRPSAP